MVKAQRPIIEISGDIISVGLPLTAFVVSLNEKDEFTTTRQAFETFAATGFSTYFLKFMIDDPRPNGERFGFPSSHTSLAFSGARFIHKKYGWQYGLPAYLMSGYVGWTRIHTDKHDIWDVLGGAALGIFLADIFTTSVENDKLDLSLYFGSGYSVVRIAYQI